jgi:transcriptional regulator GlxA family with amidase domain
MISDVVALVGDGLAAFELGVVAEVFGVDRSDGGLPVYDFALASIDPMPLTTSSGFQVITPHGLERLATADLVCIPAWRHRRQASPELLEALHAAHDRGARIMTVCTGAFLLAQTGLLDGRRATTHWRYAADFAEQFPAVEVDPAVLYVDDDPLFTSAGTAAGIDLCLHILRKEHGARLANCVARRMVVPPHRDGGQAQFVDTYVPEARDSGDLAPLLEWMLEHLDEPHTVSSLARRAAMSERTFARRFRAITGATPHSWLLRQRVNLAQRLLETGDRSVEEVARSSGFGTAAMLRHHFVRERGTSPAAYARTFGGTGTPW